MIALSNDNQWTVEWYMCLPGNTDQFHEQIFKMLYIDIRKLYCNGIMLYIDISKLYFNGIMLYVDISKLQCNGIMLYVDISILYCNALCWYP